MSVSLTLKNISRSYIKDNEKFFAVQNVNLEVKPGEFLTFLGPSGCGKTTTLRMIAGFETPTEGQILLGDKDVTKIPANERGMGFVFQNYALFPHMKIFDNVAYGLRIRKESSDLIAQKVKEALAMVGLEKAEHRYPNQLSGGEQQRVALARVLVLRDAPETWNHLRLRYPRPGRSPYSERHHRRDERRPHPADRHPDRHLQRTHQLFRCRFHRAG